MQSGLGNPRQPGLASGTPAHIHRQKDCVPKNLAVQNHHDLDTPLSTPSWSAYRVGVTRREERREGAAHRTARPPQNEGRWHLVRPFESTVTRKHGIQGRRRRKVDRRLLVEMVTEYISNNNEGYPPSDMAPFSPSCSHTPPRRPTAVCVERRGGGRRCGATVGLARRRGGDTVGAPCGRKAYSRGCCGLVSCHRYALTKNRQHLFRNDTAYSGQMCSETW